MIEVVVSGIPPEGMDIGGELRAEDLHFDGSEGFALEPGGRLELRLERRQDATVHVGGHFDAKLSLECGRCLEPFRMPLGQSLDVFYLARGADREVPEDEDEISDRDLVVAYYQEDRLDLGEMLREQILLSLPMKPVCRPDCLGICRSCGANRNLAPCSCQQAGADNPRLMPLKRLLERR